MKHCACVLALAVCSPQAWGADDARVTYQVETVAGSSRIGDGGPALAAQFSNIQGIAYHRRKFQEDLHAVLQLRHRRRGAGMSRTPLALAADLQHPSVRALLHFLITARQPNHESAHRGSDPAYEACYTAAASPWLRI